MPKFLLIIFSNITCPDVNFFGYARIPNSSVWRNQIPNILPDFCEKMFLGRPARGSSSMATLRHTARSIVCFVGWWDRFSINCSTWLMDLLCFLFSSFARKLSQNVSIQIWHVLTWFERELSQHLVFWIVILALGWNCVWITLKHGTTCPDLFQHAWSLN